MTDPKLERVKNFIETGLIVSCNRPWWDLKAKVTKETLMMVLLFIEDLEANQ